MSVLHYHKLPSCWNKGRKKGKCILTKFLLDFLLNTVVTMTSYFPITGLAPLDIIRYNFPINCKCWTS